MTPAKLIGPAAAPGVGRCFAPLSLPETCSRVCSESDVAAWLPPEGREDRLQIHAGDVGSYLRAGYLAAFAVFGYAAIAPQSFDPVRQQICQPDVEHLPHFFYRRSDLHGYEVAVVEEPSWHVSIVVLMGNFQITLPLAGDAGLYERIAEKAGVGVQANLRCRRFGWPPVYLRDRQLARVGGTGDTLSPVR